MSQTRNRSIPWLPVGGAGVLLAGVVVLALGLLSASGAASAREDAESELAVRRSAVATARQGLADAEAALGDARAEDSQAGADLQTAEAALQETRAAMAATGAALEDLQSRIPAFVLAAGDVAAGAEAALPNIEDLVERLRLQIDAVLAGDHGEFNDLRGAYPEPAGAVARQLDDLVSQFESLPELPISEPFQYAGSPLEGGVPGEPQALDPPTGPAVVTVELPDVIPCDPWGDGGCRYSWTAQFVESNWLGVTIDRIGIRYRRGNLYCTIGYSGESVYEREWDDVRIVIPASGFESTSGSLSIDPNDTCWPVRGGELLFRWRGTDAEGRSLSGSATARLESPG